MSFVEIVHAAFVLELFVLFCLRMYYHGRASVGAEHVPMTKDGLTTFLRIIFGVPLLIGYLLELTYPPLMDWSRLFIDPRVQLLGIPLGIISIAGLFWVHRHLDRNFTGTSHAKQENVLVTSGPYAYVRHPMYLFFLFGCASFTLLTASWFLGGGLTVVILVVMIERTNLEEKRLLEKHGAEYQNYRKNTGKFLPKFFR